MLAKVVEVHAFQRLVNGNTMIAESGPARNSSKSIRVGNPFIKSTRHRIRPSTHSDTRAARKLDQRKTTSSAQEAMAKVREYNPEGEVVWVTRCTMFDKPSRRPRPRRGSANKLFSAVRLGKRQTR